MGSSVKTWISVGWLARKAAGWLITLCCIVVLPSVLLVVSGYSPLVVFGGLVRGSVGNLDLLALSLDKSTPLIFAGLGATVAFRCGLWNIGIQGQILFGGLGAVLAGLYLGAFPAPVVLLVMFVLSLLFGAAWGFVPGLLRQSFRVNELVSSLLLNYVAYWFIVYLVRFPLRGKSAFGPTTDTIDSSAMFPGLWGSGPFSALKISFVLAIILGVGLWYVFRRTVFGYWIKASGTSPAASVLGGVPVGKVVLVVMAFSGGIAGLAGMSEVAGNYHVLSDGIAINYGFFGIAAALIGNMRPLAVMLVAIGIGCLLTGGLFLQASLGVSSTLVLVIIACFLIGVLVEPVIERLLGRVFRRPSEIHDRVVACAGPVSDGPTEE